MLALPAKPRRLTKRFLHKGGGVNKNLDVRAGDVVQPAGDPFQLFLDDRVIVFSLRIDGNDASFLVFER